MMFNVMKLMKFGFDIVVPLVLAFVLFLMYADVKLSAIVFLATAIGYKIVSIEKLQSMMMRVSPLIIIAIFLFLTCHFLAGTLFWITFAVLILLTIIYCFFILIFRSMNIQ